VSDRLNHRGLNSSAARCTGLGRFLCFDPRAYARGYTLPPAVGGSVVVTSILALVLGLPITNLASPPWPQTETTQPKDRYQIHLTLDFEKRTYSGSERVRFLNRGDHPTSVLFFHLYPNIRVPGYTSPAAKNELGQTVLDEPRLEITGVKSSKDGTALAFGFDDQETTLHVNLREAIMPNAETEIDINFKGSVPEIDPEETGLVTHVMQQVSAAIRSTREMRRARDTNFVCRGVMLLGSAFPILASRDGDDWLRKIELSINDAIMTDVADYEVSIQSPRDLTVFSPALPLAVSTKEESSVSTFSLANARDFPIVAGRNLHSSEREVSGVTVRSVFRAEHDVVARRVLEIATDAARIYSARFGPLPIKTISIVDAPLVATMGSAEFSGLGIIASAFYVDFDSAAMRNMPDVIREQRASVQDSLEWAVAHVVGHQWWGISVGNDPARQPVLDEALSNWSALLYYREMHGEERATATLEEQVRGVYRLYRTFGGEDMEASHAAREYRNSFQYAAIVASKGALMFEALRKLLGDGKFFDALREYYRANTLEIADMDDLRGAFLAAAPAEQRRAVSRTFNRWLSSKRGDEDIGPPDAKLAAELGLPPRGSVNKGDKNVFTPFSKLGKFFWQQMTKIR
jgi:Peptidase family M1 domain